MSMTMAENDDLPCKADSILAQVITLLEREAGILPGNIVLTDSDNIEQYKYYTQLGQIQELNSYE